MRLSRRLFLTLAGALGGRLLGRNQLAAGSTPQSFAKPLVVEGYGELVRDPKGVFDLPKGFSYHMFSRTGETMDDGLLVPTRHDGMAAFQAAGGRIILVRNHEIKEDTETSLGPFGEGNRLLNQLDSSLLYDPGRGSPPLGATTTLVYDARAARLEKHFLSLAGTLRNCSGGRTPWGSWICCEETTERAGDVFEKNHGFNFEIPAAESPSPASALPLKAMGRFTHEAVAVHAATGIFYQTEDKDDGLIYRFVPFEPGNLALGGRLQALALRDMPSADTGNQREQRIKPGEPLAVEWVDLEDVESPRGDLRDQGFSKGAARFARGEGMTSRGDEIFFTCTEGGLNAEGQLWRYTASPSEGRRGEAVEPGQLELFLEPNDRSLLQGPDNLTISPWGDVLICEDGDGSDSLMAVTPQGGLFRLGKNVMNDSELAGATFSPDGRILFLNIMEPGMTLAVRGPWEKRLSWSFHRARVARSRR